MTEPNPFGKDDESIEASPRPAMRSLAFVLALPLLVVVLLLVFSPNFKTIEGPRSAPLGGDFLQEWIGATVFAGGESSRLYDAEYVQGLEHDPELVGFEWPREDYFPMVYPPFYYQMLRPFSSVPYPWAARLWAVLSALSISLTAWLLFRFYPSSRRVILIGVVASLLFVPLLNCLNMGQKSTFLLMILASAFLLLRNQRPFLAGLVFGLMVFKPHLGVVIGAAMLLKGQWKFAAGAMTVVALALISSWLSHPQLLVDYAATLAGMGDYVQTGGYDLADSHSLWGASQLTFGGLAGGAVKGITVVLSLGVVCLLWFVLRGRLQTDSAMFPRQYAAMVIAMVLLSPHFYNYDLTILLLPMLLIVVRDRPGEWKARATDQILAMVVLGLFVLAGMFASIGGAIRVQPSVFLLVAALVLIGQGRNCQSGFPPAPLPTNSD